MIGLQFVVITLIAQRPPVRAADAGAALAAPTVVHFGVVLFLCAHIPVRWGSTPDAAIVFGAIGLGEAIYALVIARRMHTKSTYKSDFEDG